ncbi:Helix-turn-helix [Microbulbifer donghaiensis]|uniref:Helix-turn-helix n=1 Tax=Microbulbifer donghaiensis TaxID=494016 RepID=A0A1M5ILL4_9GAMM|nr:helix-turn-helix domain-containing protein [Microbulbifer donghaiensis]SHG28673.1 Helix-turn-helix [Microbulbifer donghaiensis]
MELTSQIKKRRLQLGLQQKDMNLRIGMSQQQFQRIEAGGNPRLSSLELIAEGLEAELMLVPREKIRAVKALLSNDGSSGKSGSKTSVDEDPWADILD